MEVANGGITGLPTPTNPGDVMTKAAADATVDGLIHALSVTPNVDIRTVGQTVLYTVPTGKRAIITNIVVRATTASGVLTLPCTASIGTENITYANIMAGVAMPGFGAVGKVFHQPVSGTYATAAAGDVIKANVTVGAVLTTLVCEVTLMGYLLAG